MIYCGLILILISFCGYFSFLRSKLRISFGSTVFFATSAFLLIMMLGGILHIMKLVAYLILFGGLGLIISNVICKIRSKNSLQQVRKSLAGLYFRSEYAFYSLVILLGLELFYNYHCELGSGDFWTAWYDHFYYLAINGKWSDSGYKNYASAYAMILNGGAYFFGTILNNYGSQVYTFSHYMLGIGFLMPIFSTINWRKIPFVEALLIAVTIIFNDKISDWVVSINVAVSVSLLYRVAVASRKLQVVSNFISLLGGVLFGYFILFQPMAFGDLALDSCLGCAAVGTVICFVLSYSCIWQRKRGLWLFSLPLLVLPLIKPTGIIPAACLSVLLTVASVIRIIKFRRNLVEVRKYIEAIIVIILLAVAPLLAYKLWGGYAQANGLRFQHKIPLTSMFIQAKTQLKTQVPDTTLKTWQHKIREMSAHHFLLVEPKSSFEINTEKFILPYLLKWHLGYDFYPAKAIHPRRTHAVIIAIMQVCFCLGFLFLVKRKLNYLAVLLWSLTSFLLYFPLQYYVTPMFTDVPGLFRYIWPYVVFLWGVLFCSWDMAWQSIGKLKFRGAVWEKIRTFFSIGWQSALTIGLCVVFGAIFLSIKFSYHKLPTRHQRSLPLTLIAVQSSTSTANPVYLSDPWKEGVMRYFLIKRNLITPSKKLPVLHLPKSKTMSEFTLVVGENVGRSPYKIPSDLLPGIYHAEVRKNFSVSTKLIYNNPDALDLLNRKYSFVDPECWKNNVFSVDIDGQFKNIPDGNFGRSKEWSSRTFPANAAGHRVKLQKNNWRSNELQMHADTMFNLSFNKKLFYFDRDKLVIKGVINKPVQFAVQIWIFRKKDKRYFVDSLVIGKVNLEPRKDKRYNFVSAIDLTGKRKSFDAEYYSFSLLFPQGSCSVSDLHLEQEISGYIDFFAWRRGSPSESAKK